MLEKNKNPTVKKSAFQYWNQGLTVIPMKNKKPLVKWEQWQTQKQTEKEFNGLSWNGIDGFGVLCGTKTEQGFFCAVDYDVKNLPDEIVEKGKEVLKGFPITRIERTSSGGLHYLYWSKKKPKTISGYHNIAALELLGANKLCFMAPSKGYTKLNDNSPSLVENLEFTFFKVLEQNGVELVHKTEVWFGREDLTVKGYKEKTPYCLFQMLKGTKEGDRHDYAIRLISYFVNIKKYLPETAWRKIKKWDSLNKPPLGDQELRTVFNYAMNYHFGCDDEVLKKLCTSEAQKNCPLAKKQVKKEPRQTFSRDIEASIEIELARILEAEKQLVALEPHLNNVIVGEYNNKKALMVLLSGSKYSDVKKKQIIVLKGTEGSGKTTLARELSRSYNVKKVGRFSAHALDYTDLEGYDILYLQELGAMDMEKQGVSTLKFLSVDDEGYTAEITIKDETSGKFTTEQYKIPCMTVISTTTRLILEPQFERRAWLFNIDESFEQTKKVLKWKAKIKRQEDEKILGLRELTDQEFSRELLKRYVEQLKPQKIIVPFRETLNEVLETEALRIRGDIDKLHSFIELYGLFNLKRLQKLNSDIYALTPTVAVEGLKIIKNTLIAMLSKIDTRTKKVLKALEEMKIIDVEAIIKKGDRGRLAVKIGRSDHTVLSYLNFLENSGLLRGEKKGNEKTFVLLYSLKQIEDKTVGAYSKLDSEQDLMSRMNKEAQEWFKTSRAKNSLWKAKNILFDIEFNEELKSRKTAFRGKKIGRLELGSSKGSLPEITVEVVQNEKLNKLKEDKEILIQLTPVYKAEKCELCGLYPAKYEFVIDGQPVRRCQYCIEKMQKRGIKFGVPKRERGEK